MERSQHPAAQDVGPQQGQRRIVRAAERGQPLVDPRGLDLRGHAEPPREPHLGEGGDRRAGHPQRDRLERPALASRLGHPRGQRLTRLLEARGEPHLHGASLPCFGERREGDVLVRGAEPPTQHTRDRGRRRSVSGPPASGPVR
jgi:hypothetical protein